MLSSFSPRNSPKIVQFDIIVFINNYKFPLETLYPKWITPWWKAGRQIKRQQEAKIYLLDTLLIFVLSNDAKYNVYLAEFGSKFLIVEFNFHISYFWSWQIFYQHTKKKKKRQPPPPAPSFSTVFWMLFCVPLKSKQVRFLAPPCPPLHQLAPKLLSS